MKTVISDGTAHDVLHPVYEALRDVIQIYTDDDKTLDARIKLTARHLYECGMLVDARLGAGCMVCKK